MMMASSPGMGRGYVWSLRLFSMSDPSACFACFFQASLRHFGRGNVPAFDASRVRGPRLESESPSPSPPVFPSGASRFHSVLASSTPHFPSRQPRHHFHVSPSPSCPTGTARAELEPVDPLPTSSPTSESAFLQSLKTQMRRIKKPEVDMVYAMLKEEYPGKPRGACTENVRLLLVLKIDASKIGRVFKFNRIFLKENCFERISTNLLMLQRYGFSEAQIARSIMYYPRFISFPTESIQQVLELLRSECPGIDLPRAVSCNPALFTLDVEDIKERIAHFSQVGLSNVPKVIERFSPILNLRPIAIQCKVQFYQKLFENSNAVGFLENLPQLFGFNSDRVQTTYLWLKDTMGPELALEFILSNQGILGLSIACLEEKLNFLCQVMKKDYREILRYSCVLKCSFQRRLLPRFEVLKRKNVVDKHSLSYIYSCSNAVFEKRFGVTLNKIEVEA